MPRLFHRAAAARRFFAMLLFFSMALTVLPSTAHEAQASEGPNLVPNPSLEQQNGTVPASWAKGRWGTNATTFRYPVEGVSGAWAAEVEMTQRTSGDAKWYFAEVPVAGGASYTFSDRYRSTVPTHVTVQYRHANGSVSWVDIGRPAASSTWASFEKTFTVPATATHLTVFHLINAVGILRVDAYALREQLGNAFAEGFVTLTFDDGWKTSYQNALPILEAEGLKSTQYIITGRFSFPAYVNQDEVLDMYRKGHEIGAHTRTHRDLTTLSAAERQSEISGSRQDLLGLGIAPVETLAYPFGAYDAGTTPIVQQAGYIGARTSDGGFNAKTGNIWLLKRQPVEAGTTLADVRSWVAQAKTQKLWLILVFHRVDHSGASTSITPELFQQIADEIKSSGIPVRSMSEGVGLMAS